MLFDKVFLTFLNSDLRTIKSVVSRHYIPGTRRVSHVIFIYKHSLACLWSMSQKSQVKFYAMARTNNR